MAARKVGLLAALIVAGALSLVILRSPRKAPATAAILHEEPRSAYVDPGRAAEPPKEIVQDPIIGSQRQNVGRTTEYPVAPEQVLLPEDGTVEAVMRMLNDPVFQITCAQPSEADSEVLSYMVTEARKIRDAFRAEEAERRLEAGLGERLEGYRPGEPFATPAVKRGDESVSYRFRDNDAYRIVFHFKEYPYWYALRDQIYLLEGELKLRER